MGTGAPRDRIAARLKTLEAAASGRDLLCHSHYRRFVRPEETP